MEAHTATANCPKTPIFCLIFIIYAPLPPPHASAKAGHTDVHWCSVVHCPAKMTLLNVKESDLGIVCFLLTNILLALQPFSQKKIKFVVFESNTSALCVQFCTFWVKKFDVCVRLCKFCSWFVLFAEKFTQLTKKSRQIWCLIARSTTDQGYWV